MTVKFKAMLNEPKIITKTIVCTCCGHREEFKGIKTNLKVLEETGWECGICNELPTHPKTMYPLMTNPQAWVWALKYDLNMPNQAIADVLGKSKGAVAVLHNRARKKIRAAKMTLEEIEKVEKR